MYLIYSPQNSRARSWFLFLAFIPVLGLFVTPSCDPIVTQFKVSPLHVCSGKPVTISWKTRGETTSLSADRYVSPPLGKVTNSGVMSVVINQTTTFTIESVLKGESDSKKATVELISRAGGATSIEGQAACRSGSAVYTITLEPGEWDEAIRVDTVTNVSDRPIRLAHGSSVIELDSGETTENLAGAMIGGIWTLSAELRHGEDCSGSNVPRDPNKPWQPLPFLGIEVNTSCQYP